LDHTAVLHRHLPAGKVHKLGVQFAMVLNERRAFHRGGQLRIEKKARQANGRSWQESIQGHRGCQSSLDLIGMARVWCRDGGAMLKSYSELLRLANAYSESQTLLTANDLGVFSIICRGHRSAREISQRCGADLQGLRQ